MHNDPPFAGVIGHPILHSQSPLIHGYWLKAYGLVGSYERFDIAPENLTDGISALVDQGIRGFNVTLPHKQAILPLCADISSEAQAIGAVNTVVVREDGKLSGDNTDGYGFLQNLLESCPDFDFKVSSALVLGAGGAARAILHSLKKSGVAHLYLCNRTRDHAEDLARIFGAQVVDWDDREQVVRDVQLLVNTTSLGMVGQPALDINIDAACGDCVVYDIVYAPLYTDLLVRARSRGLKTVTGIGMLLHQARPGFEQWFGIAPQVTKELRELLCRRSD